MQTKELISVSEFIKESLGKSLSYKNVEYNQQESYIIYDLDSESDLVLETFPEICFCCKTDIVTIKDVKQFEKKKKLACFYARIPMEIFHSYTLTHINSMFHFKSKIRGGGIQHNYIHLCNDCLKKGLYQWSINYPDNKYPHLRIDGIRFMSLLNNKLNPDMDKTINIIFPNIYICDYYISQKYTYLNIDESSQYEEEEL
jgi:hypothetical protein